MPFVGCALRRSNNDHKNTKAEHSLARLLLHHIIRVQGKMATYPEYEYESSDFNNRSPRMYRGKNEQQNLGFLDVFDDENDDWANYKHEEQKLLYRRGVTYSVGYTVQ